MKSLIIANSEYKDQPTIHTILLPNGSESLFILTNELLQLQKMSENTTSWMIGNWIDNCDLYIATPFDPLFILIDIEDHRYRTAYDILDARGLTFLSRVSIEARFELIFDSIEVDERMYRPSISKIGSYLQGKVDTLVRDFDSIGLFKPYAEQNKVAVVLKVLSDILSVKNIDKLNAIYGVVEEKINYYTEAMSDVSKKAKVADKKVAGKRKVAVIDNGKNKKITSFFKKK